MLVVRLLYADELLKGIAKEAYIHGRVLAASSYYYMKTAAAVTKQKKDYIERKFKYYTSCNRI